MEVQKTEFTLRRLQTENKLWVDHNFGQHEPWQPIFGAMEELGELCHAVLKAKQGIRGTPELHRAAIIDAVGDIIVYLADFVNTVDIDLQNAVEDTWNTVKQRDWKKFPKNGMTE